MFHGLEYKAVGILAYEYATCFGRNVPDSCQLEPWNISGRDWMSGFRSRHKNHRLKSPEATSITRAHGFNKKVDIFLPFCVKHLRNKKLGPMYNLDESGITTVQSVPKVIAEKRYKAGGTSYGSRAWNTSDCAVVQMLRDRHSLQQ